MLKAMETSLDLRQPGAWLIWLAVTHAPLAMTLEDLESLRTSRVTTISTLLPPQVWLYKARVHTDNTQQPESRNCLEKLQATCEQLQGLNSDHAELKISYENLKDVIRKFKTEANKKQQSTMTTESDEAAKTRHATLTPNTRSSHKCDSRFKKSISAPGHGVCIKSH